MDNQLVPVVVRGWKKLGPRTDNPNDHYSAYMTLPKSRHEIYVRFSKQGTHLRPEEIHFTPDKGWMKMTNMKVTKTISVPSNWLEKLEAVLLCRDIKVQA